MKLCPKCSAKNPNDSKFCNSCGASLETVEVTSSVANDFLGKANVLLTDGAKRAREATETGLGKAKQVATAGKEKLDRASLPRKHSPTAAITDQSSSSWASASQNVFSQNSSWDNPVNQDNTHITVEKYPFFQSEEEKTIAVIGEQFAAADLEGTYQAPYAILTQKKLYCKNESGYFIKQASEIETLRLEYQARNYWLIGIVLLVVQISLYFCAMFDSVIYGFGYGLVLSFVLFVSLRFENKRSKIKLMSPNVPKIYVGLAVMLTVMCIFFGKLFAGILILLIGLFDAKYMHQCIQSPRILSVSCAGGTFSFEVDHYPQQEVTNFIDKALPSNQKAKFSSYQANTAQRPAKSGKVGVIIICVIVAVFVVVGGFWYFETHCKVFGCDREPVIDGYCRYHYAEKKVDSAYNDAEDFFGELFGN